MTAPRAAASGEPWPFGAVPSPHGVNFALFSRHATAVTLCVYERAEDAIPAFEVRLDPARHRTGDVWHCFVPGLAAGALYAYRVDGPFDPTRGFRFNPRKILLDPYAKALTGGFVWNLPSARGAALGVPDADLVRSEVDDAGDMPKCVVVSDDFDWRGDRPLNKPLRHCVIYEAHLAGLTRHPSSGVRHPGTYRGLVEIIPRLKSLGITTLELLPVQEFDHFENERVNPRTGERLRNYWGYSTMAFFAPKGSYSAGGSSGEQVAEFKEMVRELHAADIEVVLDVVFNHTAEGNEFGPTISFRGLDNPIYYMLDEDPRRYKNYSGCGNTVNCNHPVVRNLIMDCLRYWVVEMHVDGFRFDLGSILGRDQRGRMLENPPMIEQIAEDPLLRDTKIIAEAWDAGGAYQVGAFPGGRWAEWNDRFRDDTRRFWRGDPDTARLLATRITGSSDLYLRDGRKPFHSINFVTAHDGFTLADLVSFAKKHNEENGEGGTDGAEENASCNYGFEGPVDNPAIREIRARQTRNFLATLLLSTGTPMICGGDEFGRTQGGNNNAYCQDNEISWLDWELAEERSALVAYVRGLIEFRMRHPAFRRPEFFTGRNAPYNPSPDILWYGPDGEAPDWARVDGALACRIDGSHADVLADRDECDFFLVFNASAEDVKFALPPATPGTKWFRVLDTALPDEFALVKPGEEELVLPQDSCVARARTMLCLKTGSLR